MAYRRVAKTVMPRCTKCGSFRMSLVHTEARTHFQYRYERQTYQCDDCRNRQTYTMGRRPKEDAQLG
jgi:hypothetical protein